MSAPRRSVKPHRRRRRFNCANRPAMDVTRFAQAVSTRLRSRQVIAASLADACLPH